MRSLFWLGFCGCCLTGLAPPVSATVLTAADQTTVVDPTPAAGQTTAPGPQSQDESADIAEFRRLLVPFLTTYCFECHAGEDAAGERSLDELTGVLTDENSLVEMQDILDQLNLGEMPPHDAKQPGQEERRAAISWLTETISSFHASRRSPAGETTLRRLNAREYRHTVRDVFGLNMTMFDPTVAFPRDQLDHHLDNSGEALVMSGYLLGQYLTAAEAVVNKAMLPVHRPAVQTWSFTDNFRQQPEIDQVHRDTSRFEYLILYDVPGADKHEGAYAPIHAFAEGVPHDGYYEIEFRAAAVNRLHPYDDRFLGRDSSEPLRLGIVAGNRHDGPLHKPQPNEPKLAEIALKDGWQTCRVRIWLDAGITPRFIFPNGLMDARNLWGTLHRRYPDLLPKLKTNGIVEVRRNAIKHGQLPQIHVDDITITGPFYDAWPKESQRILLGDDWDRVVEGGDVSEDVYRQHLHRLASRAWRRPATSAEFERLWTLMQTRLQVGRSALQAYGDAVQAMLCSSGFLYLDESPEDLPETSDAAPSRTDRPAAAGAPDQLRPGAGGASTARPLGQHALASRLSYFLWASLPDEILLQAAAEGRLSDDDELQRQVSRLLLDSRSEAMIDGFLDSWLMLRDLGSMPPDRTEFRAYYQYDLGTAMKQETRLFTQHLIRNNLSVRHFLDSDFAFVNRSLARHYELDIPLSELPTGDEFQLVSLKNARRGGLLGQASVLTVTANGIDTSPVVRGVWLLENICGTPPSPPPPDVEPLDPDVRGAITIRDQLNRHRNVPACFDCHRKIDPPGFALENYDPIGRWRDTYKRGARIDATGELSGGRTFQDVTELKQILVEQEQQFTLALARRLLAYAAGRPSMPSDRPHLDAIVVQLQTTGGGLRDLIQHVVLSAPFRSE